MLYGGAALALVTLSSPETVRTALATSASALVEATPFVFAGAALGLVLRRKAGLVAHLGCGCTAGPSARSLPAAAATWLLFGPVVAIARYAAALLVARGLRSHSETDHEHSPHPLAELGAVLPAAVMAGASIQLLPGFDTARLSPIARAAIGAALGFTSAPCGLGAVALAGALRVHAPVTAVAFLCVAGIADLRALRRNRIFAPITMRSRMLSWPPPVQSSRGDTATRSCTPLWRCRFGVAPPQRYSVPRVIGGANARSRASRRD
jgi:hypothetical protein